MTLAASVIYERAVTMQIGVVRSTLSRVARQFTSMIGVIITGKGQGTGVRSNVEVGERTSRKERLVENGSVWVNSVQQPIFEQHQESVEE